MEQWDTQNKCWMRIGGPKAESSSQAGGRAAGSPEPIKRKVVGLPPSGSASDTESDMAFADPEPKKSRPMPQPRPTPPKAKPAAKPTALPSGFEELLRRFKHDGNKLTITTTTYTLE
jgi:hypothetical protein